MGFYGSDADAEREKRTKAAESEAVRNISEGLAGLKKRKKKKVKEPTQQHEGGLTGGAGQTASKPGMGPKRIQGQI